MVVLKCIGVNSFYLEKVVMPSEIFCFSAPPQARVEIWQMAVNGQILRVRGDVEDLLVNATSLARPIPIRLWPDGCRLSGRRSACFPCPR